jgi:hypothetical protein
MEMTSEDKKFLGKLAKKIVDYQMVTPTIFFLEITKPLSFIGSQAMVFFGPIINAFVNSDGYYRAAEIFEHPANIEFLIQEIERLSKK